MWSLRYALEAAVPSARSSHVTLWNGLYRHQGKPTSTGGHPPKVSPAPRGPQGPRPLWSKNELRPATSSAVLRAGPSSSRIGSVILFERGSGDSRAHNRCTPWAEDAASAAP